MSLIEDARELARISPFEPHITKSGATVCRVCGRGHCPIRSIPKIVAALEAAEALTVAYEEARIIFGAPLGYRFKALCEKLDEALDA